MHPELRVRVEKLETQVHRETLVWMVRKAIEAILESQVCRESQVQSVMWV